MTDNLTKDARKNMRAIRSKGTKLEEIVTRRLWLKGFRFRKNVNDLYGKPDIAIKKYRVVIFLDSCFWHCCPDHSNVPKTNKEYWIKKLNRNVERDKIVTNYYKEQDWMIMRIWEHEVKDNPERVVGRIAELITNSKELKK